MRNAIPLNSSGKVLKGTLVCWARHVLFLACYNILGPVADGTGRSPSVAHGVRADKSDSLWALVMNGALPVMVRKLGLS